jgi:predicted transglutaminase-like cysteine proteinase
MATTELARALARMRDVGLAAALLTGLATVTASATMATGGLTSQPIGHYEFCQRHPKECLVRSRDAGPSKMSSGLWKQLVSVNASVNRAVKPMSDMEVFGREEHWAYPDQGVGDCEDYVLEKRRRLAARGVSLSHLLITVVRKPDGEGHAVLTVRTTDGDFVLDNLHDSVRPWRKTGYRFIKRQSSVHAGRWVTIRGEQNVLVGSVQQ